MAVVVRMVSVKEPGEAANCVSSVLSPLNFTPGAAANDQKPHPACTHSLGDFSGPLIAFSSESRQAILAERSKSR